MMTLSISQLKAHLSATIRSAAAGERVVVVDRHRPVVEIVPFERKGNDLWEGLARKYGVRLGTQSFSDFKPVRLKKRIDVVALSREIQED
jgi:prevent-host-death family protein